MNLGAVQIWSPVFSDPTPQAWDHIWTAPYLKLLKINFLRNKISAKKVTVPATIPEHQSGLSHSK